MADAGWSRERYGEAFWRAHHEAWRPSDLNQREYCEAHGLSLKAFGNWRAKFKAEPQPPVRKLLYRRGGLSHTLSHSLSHPLSHVTYPSSWSDAASARPGPAWPARRCPCAYQCNPRPNGPSAREEASSWHALRPRHYAGSRRSSAEVQRCGQTPDPRRGCAARREPSQGCASLWHRPAGSMSMEAGAKPRRCSSRCRSLMRLRRLVRRPLMTISSCFAVARPT
jgi:hypothetical protein